MAHRHIASGAAAAVLCGLLAACGSSSSSSGSPGGGASSSTGTGASTTLGAGALSAEVRSAATGDIPDNQVFLTFRDPSAGYSVPYPEGWAQTGAGGNVTFQDKNNVIHIVVAPGSPPTPAAVTATLNKERARLPSLIVGTPSTTSIAGSPVVKVSYSTFSQPNPVTGKRVQLLVDRYVIGHAGKVLVIDLGTPKGVDNVDAYRRISHSLRWL